MNDVKALAELILSARDVVALTGAGASTESGIPDFRSPDTGLWAQMDPMELFARDVLERDPAKFWLRGAPVFRELASAKPNSCHDALAWLEEQGLIRGIITQNIDDLHQRAGSRQVLEVHGHLRTGSCACGQVAEMKALLDRVEAGDNPPRCRCGGIFRPDVTLFGDALPPAFETAWQWAHECELLLVVGSSLEVAPVCWLVPRATAVAIVNLAETNCDDLAEVVVRGQAGDVLSAVVATISTLSSKQ
ncbi:MAG: NAD-dependent deacylase [Firmicutes bacterium]|nr:NAD-dependent deacylase [Bacillota bacterium]